MATRLLLKVAFVAPTPDIDRAGYETTAKLSLFAARHNSMLRMTASACLGLGGFGQPFFAAA